MRSEFSKQTKRDAYDRSLGFCEGSGQRYGLPIGKRCNASLSRGIIYDHDNPDANSKDNSLGNCRCICLACNKFKTGKIDIPMIAKTQRQQDKARGITKAKPKSRWKRKLDGTTVLR